MKLKKYSKYKNSGIDWIGEIPEEWNLLPIMGVCEIGRGRVISNLDIGENEGKYPVYSSQTTNNGEMGRINTYDFNGEYVTWTTDGANAGTVFYRNGKFNCTNVCGTLKQRENKKILMTYLPYILNGGTKYFVRYDINPKLMNDVMARIRIPIPPLEIQQKISSFLDSKTTQIEKLIEKDRNLIEFLKEKRISLINQSVTKGIKKNVKMKDSGVEWIGEIPENWKIIAIRRITNVVRGASPRPAGSPLYFDGDYINWITVAEVTKGVNEKYLFDTETSLTKQGSLNSRIIKINTLLLSNSGATLGVPKITKIKGCINDGSVAFLNLKNIDINFLFYYFSQLTQELRNIVQGSGQPNLNTELVKELKLGIPSIEEQQKIVEFLDKETVKIDNHIKKVERRIELYEEYKKSLIYNVVTGKVEV